MRVDTRVAGPVEPTPQRVDVATLAVETFRRSGRLDAELVRLAPSGGLARAMASLPPAERGALEAALGRAGLGEAGLEEAGLGDLVGDALGAAVDVADVAADPLVETPSEQSAEAMQGDVQARWLSDLRGQAELDAALSPFAKLDRPVAGLAATTSVRTIADRDS